MGPWDALAALDAWLLLKINRAWTSPFLDAAMPALTDLHKLAWFWFAAPAALGLWLWRGRRRALQVLVVLGLACGSADLLSYRVLKPAVRRLRPSVAGQPVVLRAPVSGKPGFPSNHAVNMGAGAAVLSSAYPLGAPLFWAAAAAVAYSRVYCGAHYPADVLAGLALGALVGWLWAALLKRWLR
ncbi:MAG: phosphatase PAP2 family protein [Elusimicrobia bacterium]|nr:phosphatase PAP2 family protein [Elusimicrobiota bacterium]